MDFTDICKKGTLMKKFILVLFLGIVGKALGQIDAKIYYEKTENGYSVYGDNHELCEVSIELNFTLVNLESDIGAKKIIVLPAQSQKIKVASLTVINSKSMYKFSYTTLMNWGNHYLDKYDIDYVYQLPFQAGEKYKIGQGYNGNFSHQNQNALDFTMPVGTLITAARGGTVVAVTQKHYKTCAQKSCAEFNNYITIQHSDGTFAEYTHIKQNGALVKKGDKVTMGQPLAKSGNVGWSNGPHLHFVVYIQRLTQRETLKTKFQTLNGVISQLEEKVIYER